MKYDKDKVDEAVLALLYLGLHDEGRVWKAHDWDAMGRLYEEGMISDPVGKTKSVVLTAEGIKRSNALFMKLFGTASPSSAKSLGQALDAQERHGHTLPTGGE